METQIIMRLHKYKRTRYKNIRCINYVPCESLSCQVEFIGAKQPILCPFSPIISGNHHIYKFKIFYIVES